MVHPVINMRRLLKKRSVLMLFPILLVSVAISGPSGNTNQNKRLVSVAGVGDIMPGSSYPSARYLPPGDDPAAFISEAAGFLKEADIAVGNLEGSFLDYGEPYKKCRDTTICYLFRIPERYSSVLSKCGFDFISIANNHFLDFGYAGATRTMKILDSLGISFAGTETVPYSIIVRDSLTFGFCAFSTTTGSVILHDYGRAEEIVRALDKKCNIVIVSVHAGAEGASYQRVVKGQEFFYGENRGNVYEFAHRMIDAGADIIFGHGPHVPRALEVYRERLICYSLGNFFTYGRMNISGPNGLAPVIIVNTDTEGRFVSGTIHSFQQTYQGPVRPDPLRQAVKKIRELTLLDFPETGPQISDNGEIKPV